MPDHRWCLAKEPRTGVRVRLRVLCMAHGAYLLTKHEAGDCRQRCCNVGERALHAPSNHGRAKSGRTNHGQGGGTLREGGTPMWARRGGVKTASPPRHPARPCLPRVGCGRRPRGEAASEIFRTFRGPFWPKRPLKHSYDFGVLFSLPISPPLFLSSLFVFRGQSRVRWGGCDAWRANNRAFKQSFRAPQF